MPTVRSEPATKADVAEAIAEAIAEAVATLRGEIATLRSEMATKRELADMAVYLTDWVRAAMAEQTAWFSAEMAKQTTWFSAEMARQINASAEETRAWFKTLDDRAQATSSNHDRLREDFDQHRDDRAIHRVPRRTRRSAR